MFFLWILWVVCFDLIVFVGLFLFGDFMLMVDEVLLLFGELNVVVFV